MDWQTPGYFLDLVRDVDVIDLDPCAPGEAHTPWNNPTGAVFHLHQTIARGCGLSLRWADAYRGGLAFVNPPYGAHLSGDVVDPDARIMRRPKGSPKGTPPVEIGRGTGWARKIVESTGIPRIGLLPARPDADWWAFMLKHADEALLWRSPKYGARLKFRDPSTERLVTGNTAPSTVFYFGNTGTGHDEAAGDAERRARFRRVFGEHGTLIKIST